MVLPTIEGMHGLADPRTPPGSGLRGVVALPEIRCLEVRGGLRLHDDVVDHASGGMVCCFRNGGKTSCAGFPSPRCLDSSPFCMLAMACSHRYALPTMSKWTKSLRDSLS
jgi:hypothetical protein